MPEPELYPKDLLKTLLPRGRGSVDQRPNGKLRVRLWSDGKALTLGHYDTPDEVRAAASRVKWEANELSIIEGLGITLERIVMSEAWSKATEARYRGVYLLHVMPLLERIEKCESDPERAHEALIWWQERASIKAQRAIAWRLLRRLVIASPGLVGYQPPNIPEPAKSASTLPTPRRRLPIAEQSKRVEAYFKNESDLVYMWKLVFLARRLGGRLGELLGICPQAIDAATSTIRIERVLERGRSAETDLREGAKNDSSVRSLPVAPGVLEEILSWCDGPFDRPLIRTSTGGSPSESLVLKNLRRAQRAVAFEGEPPMTWHFHSLRHEVLTNLAALPKLSVAEVGAMAGHRPGSTSTLKYLHPSAERLAEAVRVLNVD